MEYKIKFTAKNKVYTKKYGFCNSKNGTLKMFKTTECANYEKFIAWIGKNYMQLHNLKPLSGEIFIKIIIYIEDKKKINLNKNNNNNQNCQDQIYSTSKPDCSNVLKSIEDALTYICFKDDKNIVSGQFDKFCCSSEKEERVDVFITNLWSD